jgi:hypothetical protein
MGGVSNSAANRAANGSADNIANNIERNQTRAAAKVATLFRGAIVRRRKRGQPAVAALSRRLRAPADVPSSGQIVFRSASQILR